MARYLELSALIAEIDKRITDAPINHIGHQRVWAYNDVKDILNTLEVKEMNWEKERMEECPYRQVGCTMYEGKILECRGACSWVVDYPKLKELKAQNGV